VGVDRGPVLFWMRPERVDLFWFAWDRCWRGKQNEASLGLFNSGCWIDSRYSTQGFQEVPAKVHHAGMVRSELTSQVLPGGPGCYAQLEHSIGEPLIDI